MANLVANINIIVAASENNCIGKNNDLPWNLPTDLKRFKTLTNGHIVVMGRKCWESIPAKFRPLPNRTNVVITRDKNYIAEGAHVRHDFHEAINEFAYGAEELFVIGGSEIYKEGFKFANKLHLTRIMAEVEGDVFLEGLVPSDWIITEFEGPITENGFTYRFDTYTKKQ